MKPGSAAGNDGLASLAGSARAFPGEERTKCGGENTGALAKWGRAAGLAPLHYDIPKLSITNRRVTGESFPEVRRVYSGVRCMDATGIRPDPPQVSCRMLDHFRRYPHSDRCKDKVGSAAALAQMGMLRRGGNPGM